ncbi:hypothetical protein Tco_0953457 [Tanacetum coccineum]|uniref:Uncharacterized protein n=1 Tax=Tanacetum coccineum TaxID=301880 RepID=A0ABQ5DZY7_9ASTR
MINSDHVPQDKIVPSAEKTDRHRQDWGTRSSIRTSTEIPTMPVHTNTAATDPEMCMFALTLGIDFEESFAPVATRLEPVRIFVAHPAKNNTRLFQSIRWTSKTRHSMVPLKEEFSLHSAEGSLEPRVIQKKD